MTNEPDLPNEALEPIRDRVDINVGALVQRGESVFRITQLLDFASLIGVEVETGRATPLRIGDLRPLARSADDIPNPNRDVAEIADEDWRIAQQRFSAIKPFINRSHIGREDIETRGKELGIDPATLYRWIQRYNACGVVTALIPRKRGWKPGSSRIDASADALIEQVIRDFYLTAQRPTAQKTIIEVLRACLLTIAQN